MALSLTQGATEASPVLRRQRLQVGLYTASSDGALDLDAVLPVTLTGPSTDISEARGRPCPALVYANHDDWGYVKVALSDEAVTAIAAHVNDVGSPLARAMLWQALWDMTQGGALPLTRFADIVLLNIAREENEKVLDQVLTALVADIAFLHALDAPPRYRYVARVENFLWSNAVAAPRGSDLQKLWLDHFVSVAVSDRAMKTLWDLLAGEPLLAGAEIDQDRRWAMIVRLNAVGHAGAEDLIEAERKRDPSSAGLKGAIAARASRPSTTVKAEWLNEFADAGSALSFSEQRAAMQALFPSHQADLHHQHLRDMLQWLPGLSSTRDDYFLASYVGNLFHGVCRNEDVRLLETTLENTDALNVTAIKFLREAHQEAARCVALGKSL